MNWRWLVISPLVIFAQNVRLPKWEEAYQNTRPFQISTNYYNEDISSDDIDSTFNSPKYLTHPFPDENLHLLNMNKLKSLMENIDEAYENKKGKAQNYVSNKFHGFNPDTSKEVKKQPRRYIPGHLYENVPLTPSAPRTNYPHRSSIGLSQFRNVYRPSHRYGRGPSNFHQSEPNYRFKEDDYRSQVYDTDYDSKEAGKTDYEDSEYPTFKSFTYPLRLPHKPYSPRDYKPNPAAIEEYASPNEKVNLDDYQRKPDPYYVSSAYARDKHFGVDPDFYKSVKNVNPNPTEQRSFPSTR